MNKIKIIKAIVKVYFAGAVYFSFSHVMHAWMKAGLVGAEAVGATVAIDLMFIVAMILRSDDFSSRTRKIGFRTMLVMGTLSLAGNIYAAHNLGGVIFGAMLPGYLLFSEWLADPKQITSAKSENESNAIAEAERIAQAEADAIAAKKAAAIAKGRATRAANARKNKAQVKALESLVNGK